MTKADQYREALKTCADWDTYLMQESGLPGPRGNLELAQAAADEATAAQIDHWLTFDPVRAPVNSPGEFLAFCGVVGVGRLIVEGQIDRWPALRRCASDPRWRTREGVAMALQAHRQRRYAGTAIEVGGVAIGRVARTTRGRGGPGRTQVAARSGTRRAGVELSDRSRLHWPLRPISGPRTIRFCGRPWATVEV